MRILLGVEGSAREREREKVGEGEGDSCSSFVCATRLPWGQKGPKIRHYSLVDGSPIISYTNRQMLDTVCVCEWLCVYGVEHLKSKTPVTF